MDDYASEDSLPKVESCGIKYKRVHIVFDVCKKSSLKSETRSKRGKDVRKNDNKTELLNFLAWEMCQSDATSTVVVTRGDDAIRNRMRSLDAVAPYSNEEADTRVFVHARDATFNLWKVCKFLIIKANDTYVVAIVVATLPYRNHVDCI